MITSVSSEIHYPKTGTRNDAWGHHLDYRWNPTRLREAMTESEGLELQEDEHQRRHKVSYYIDGRVGPDRAEIVQHLRQEGLQATVIYSHGQYLDLLPVHASKGMAVRYLAIRWGLPMERVVTVGDAGNDEDMLSGDACAIVVGNHSEELDALRGLPRIYFANGEYARGVIEGLQHYDFFGDFAVKNVGTDVAAIEEGEALANESAR